ncbi:MAG: hypothetical protein KKB37_11370 [Alphaproteobacteria bacterium]|nr:hypothetical protein [Alphaproteobacteria bacterium]
MSLSVRHAGAWKEVAQPYVKQGGVWKPVRDGFGKQGGVWKNFYMAEEVVTLSASAEQVNIANLFSLTEWAGARTKRLIIPPGIVLGSTSSAVAALRSGAGRGGALIIENGGELLGAGGAANSGAGGPAFLAEQSGIQLLNSGSIMGGGGGGGTGGQGGPGYYTYTVTEGPHWNISNTYWNDRNLGGNGSAYWYGTYLGQPYHLGPISKDGWNYYAGNLYGGYNWSRTVYRQQSQTAYTTGGAGGAGGRGRGYNQTPLSGSAGSAGGTNAGTGGTGGAGREWGLAGSAGATGASGNNGGGLSGSSGGAAGAAILNPGNVSLTNTGTLAGAY